MNNNVFQCDVYRPLVAPISQHALMWGVVVPVIRGGVHGMGGGFTWALGAN